MGESNFQPEVMFTVLSNGTRLTVLSILASRESPLSLTELARLVREELPATERRPPVDELVVSLHHVHLPKLAEVGVLEYDALRRSISPRPPTATLVSEIEQLVPTLQADGGDSGDEHAA